MKSVLIIGAGPAGLVAAKTLLQYAGGTKFKVTVFEAAERVGGMWRYLPGEKGEMCSPHMRTNLSRFTVAFPDLSWESVDLSNPVTGEEPSGPPSMFPPAWHVGRYLESYAKKYLAPDTVQLNRRVTGADLNTNHPGTWNVTSMDQIACRESRHAFDYLIVASGFFHRAGPGVRRAELHEEAGTRIQHSTQFRDVASFSDKAGKVVVIGGGISGAEAAATAAFQISSAKHTPGKKMLACADSQVYHIFDRPFYALPRYIPQNPYIAVIQDSNLSPRFLPLDLLLYNIGRRSGDGPITAAIGRVPPEKAKKGHEFLRSLLGGDQRATGRSELVYKPDKLRYPAYIGVSDTYAEFVRDGLIIPVQGRVENITQNAETYFSVDVTSQGPWSTVNQEVESKLHDVTGVIDATGFQTHLEYLSDDIKHALDYDPHCHRLPFLLSRGSIFNSRVPHIAFVGFYEGPYWGVMDMQARIIAQTWDSESLGENATEKADVTDARLVRKSVKDGAMDIPQFWMSDYVGIMEEFARRGGLQRDDSTLGEGGPLFPSRYHDKSNIGDASKVVGEVADILRRSEEVLYVAAAAFRGMQGTWSLQRKMDSRHASLPCGSFQGIARFHPRTPTDAIYSAEYLYVEEGTLTMDNGMSFPATRRYVYRYDEQTDTVTAWFAEEDGLTVGGLFNTWEFYSPSDTYHGWLARGSHWCSPDTYKSNCEFRFRGASLETFGITYDVVGPNKDYSHESWYSRPTSAGA